MALCRHKSWLLSKVFSNFNMPIAFFTYNWLPFHTDERWRSLVPVCVIDQEEGDWSNTYLTSCPFATPSYLALFDWHRKQWRHFLVANQYFLSAPQVSQFSTSVNSPARPHGDSSASNAGESPCCGVGFWVLIDDYLHFKSVRFCFSNFGSEKFLPIDSFEYFEEMISHPYNQSHTPFD